MPVFRIERRYYQQRPLRFTDDTLSTAQIATPLDVAAAPGGTRWRQTNVNLAFRYVNRGPYWVRRFAPGAVAASITFTEADDVVAATATVGNAPLPWGAMVAEAQRSAFRPALHRAYFSQRRKLIGPSPANASITFTEADDAVAATATVAPAPTATNQPVQEAQRLAYRPALHRAYTAQPRKLIGPAPANASITFTEADDVVAATGTAAAAPVANPAPIRQRCAYRPTQHRAFTAQARRFTPPSTTDNASIVFTEADDTVAVTAGSAVAPTPYPRRSQVRPWRYHAYCQRRARIDVSVPPAPVTIIAGTGTGVIGALYSGTGTTAGLYGGPGTITPLYGGQGGIT